jgi:BTB/POZ domain
MDVKPVDGDRNGGVRVLARQCPTCARSFTSRGALRQHLSFVASGELSAIAKAEAVDISAAPAPGCAPFRCGKFPTCRGGFLTRAQALQHARLCQHWSSSERETEVMLVLSRDVLLSAQATVAKAGSSSSASASASHATLSQSGNKGPATSFPSDQTDRHARAFRAVIGKVSSSLQDFMREEQRLADEEYRRRETVLDRRAIELTQEAKQMKKELGRQLVSEFAAELERLRRSKAELAADRAAFEEEKGVVADTQSKAATRLVLNVGGQRFETSRTTLSKSPFFATYFSKRWDTKPDSDGSYFIDRSPRSFEYILEFLRNGSILVEGLKLRDRHLLRQDAEFYQMEGLLELLDAA